MVAIGPEDHFRVEVIAEDQDGDAPSPPDPGGGAGGRGDGTGGTGDVDPGSPSSDLRRVRRQLESVLSPRGETGLPSSRPQPPLPERKPSVRTRRVMLSKAEIEALGKYR